MTRSRSRIWRFRIAAALLGLAVLLLLDVALGSLLNGLGLYPVASERHYRVFDDRCHHTLRPSFSYDYAQAGPIIYPVRTNSLGFKDAEVREVSLTKTTPKRLLLMGDSFTEGIGMVWEQTFAGMLAEDLAGRGYEVLNAGVASYAPIFHLCILRRLVGEEGLEVDEVIVLIDLSDIYDETRYRFDEQRGAVVSVGSLIDDKAKSFLETHTLLLHILRKKFGGLRELWNPRDEKGPTGRWRCAWTYDPEAWTAYGEEGLARATAHMDRIAAFLRERGIKLTVAVYPWPDQIVSRQRDCLQRTHWAEWCRRQGVGFVDLFPLFLDSGPPQEVLKRLFIPGDYHWNKEGHRAVADRLLRDAIAAAD